MFKPTGNPYQFKYLQTGITGPGIEQVYLPEQPPDDQVLFKKEQKWTRPEMPEYLKKATRVLYHKHNPESKDYDPTFISPYLKEIQDWIDQEWERTETGIWFWNNGVKTYITKIHYFYLTAWQTYFGYPDYRDPDREIFYLLEYCEEDPDSYGFILNTLRRFGKSAIMGAWITYRTIRNKNHFAGMQGETDPKIATFYDTHILKPFYKLPPYYQPEYNTDTKQSAGIEFTINPKRGKKLNAMELEDIDVLESSLDYRASVEGAYDQAVLHSYLMEEPGKCSPAGTKVRMYDGSLKNVEDVKIGDLLRGDDNIPREVKNTGKGFGRIYKIIPNSKNKAKPWYVNEDHILSCKVSTSTMFKGLKKGDVLNISVKDYLQLTKNKKRHLMCYRVGVEYPERYHTINPYLLGLWLGDGSSNSVEITNQDKEVVHWIYDYSRSVGFTVKKKMTRGRTDCYSISNGTGILRGVFRDKHLLNNKHIPIDYLIDSRKNRLELLAGLIDTDGHRISREHRPNQRSYEITQKNQRLAHDIKELCFSLGFYASLKEKTATMRRKDGTIYKCQVYRIDIYGRNLHEIPCRIERKKMPSGITTYNSKDPSIYGFSVEYDRDDFYYGFNISGNRLYLLEDYTVTHNTLKANVAERWKVVKPCLKRGKFIRGKAFMGTTVEYMDVSKRGGKAYQKLFYESDFNKRQPDGRTKSGLYACFLPSDCGLEGYFDEWGIPIRDKAREWILAERAACEDDPKDYSDQIRKYPLSIAEIFYINTSRCEFNATILQDRRAEIDSSEEPFWSRYDLRWENNVRFSKVIPHHNPASGWMRASWLPKDHEKEANLIGFNHFDGEKYYHPKNDMTFAAGCDPIDHGIVIEGKSNDNDEEFLSARRSKPVLLLKRKYDFKIDGMLDREDMEMRAKRGKMVDGKWILDPKGAKFQYKTNRYIVMMDSRPYDPNVFYERALMICWYFGCSLHVESQKPGIIRYFHDNNCGDFIMKKYAPIETRKRSLGDEGTPASQSIIQEYTGLLSSYVEYFGHTLPFREVVEDLLLFNPLKTKEYDYAVAMGFTELACLIEPKNKPKPLINIEDIMPVFDDYGNLIN